MKTFYNAMRAEWIKMWSIKSAMVSTIIIAVFGVASSAFVAWLYRSLLHGHGIIGPFAYPPEELLMGVTGIGFLVVMIFSVTMVTTEYSTLTIESTFRATPRRPIVFLAKMVVGGLYMALVGLVSTFLSALVAKLVAINVGDAEIFSSTWANYYWRIPVAFFLLALLSMGIGMIIRNTAGAIALLVVWMTAIETILLVFSAKVDFGPYLPFQNIYYFINGSATTTVFSFKWNQYGAGAYFFGIAALLFIIGLFVADPALRKFKLGPKPVAVKATADAPVADSVLPAAPAAPSAAAVPVAPAAPVAPVVPGTPVAPAAGAPTSRLQQVPMANRTGAGYGAGYPVPPQAGGVPSQAQPAQPTQPGTQARPSAPVPPSMPAQPDNDAANRDPNKGAHEL